MTHKERRPLMSEKKHSCCNWWMMVLCCAIPILIIIGMQYFGYQGYANWLVFLLCPLIHGVMMWFMFKAAKNESTES
jgi:putative effector of murein hydrolase